MKTPMQEMIEILKEEERVISEVQYVSQYYSALDKSYIDGLRIAIEYAESLLEKEKEVIMEAYWEGGQDVPVVVDRCEDYYNKTFNTKEK